MRGAGDRPAAAPRAPPSRTGRPPGPARAAGGRAEYCGGGAPRAPASELAPGALVDVERFGVAPGLRQDLEVVVGAVRRPVERERQPQAERRQRHRVVEPAPGRQLTVHRLMLERAVPGDQLTAERQHQPPRQRRVMPGEEAPSEIDQGRDDPGRTGAIPPGQLPLLLAYVTPASKTAPSAIPERSRHRDLRGDPWPDPRPAGLRSLCCNVRGC